MTMTETHSDAMAPHSAGAIDVVARVTDWTTTVDHRRVGRLFVGTGLLAGLGTLVLAVLIAADRIDATRVFLPVSATYQMATLSRVALAFLVVAPILLGLAIAVVPSQVGSSTIAFPRAVTLAFTTWLGGSVLVVGSVLANGGPGGGSDWNVQLFLAGLAITVLGLLIAAVCVVATVLTLRAPGLSLDRVPLFSFAWLITGSIMLLSWAVLLSNLVNLYVSHRYGQVPFGNSTKIMGYIDWAFTGPGVSLFALPALGFIGDSVPTFARSRQPLRSVMLVAIGFAGLNAFGADLQRSLYPEVNQRALMILASLGVILPFLLVLGLSAVALRSGKPTFGAPLLFAVSSGVVGLLAAVAGAILPLRSGDLTPALGAGVSSDGLRVITSTIFPATQATAMLFAGLLAGCGALAYWGPRLWGRKLADKTLAPLALAGLLGSILVLVGEGIGAFNDQPIDEVSFASSNTLKAVNVLATIGYGLVALMVLGTIALALKGFLKGDRAGVNPWDGQSLEWSEDGTNDTWVRSAQPLYDRKDA
jgi:cytochrome c oxidase subunit I